MAPESPAGPTEPVTAAPAPADLAMIPVGTTTPLAKVNGVEITLKDLMPLNAAAATPQDLRADAFAQLLGLAIEREIIFQAAQAQGVELTDEHRQSLEEVRSAALARANAPYVLPGYDAEAQAAFEVRAESARMLEDVLLGASPIVYRPASPEDVETYYESHKAEFGKLPKNPAAREQAWQAIVAEIRSRLAYASSTEREQRRNQLLEELKAQAAIERLAPGSIPESPQPH
ncbi:MAG: SurA N-terminal domain-containing protein [Akkermansiaceae bacterium]|jgi:hypothetical protein|nr:SurA N-terminal domain-containing protein [Akkermansiaceae bacterium]